MPVAAQKGLRTKAAFTITELMVAVSLMSLIVIALYAMFNQTQKAMRANEAQVDSTERGRGVLELVSREFESARAGMRFGVTNLWVDEMVGLPKLQGDLLAGSSVAPRTNVFSAGFYLTKSGKAWRGVGYTVLQRTNDGTLDLLTPPPAGMGSLYRYETPEAGISYGFPSNSLFQGFVSNAPSISFRPVAATNLMFSQICDGVVHFRLTPYDTRGRAMVANSALVNLTNALDPNYMLARFDPAFKPYPYSNKELDVTNALLFANVALQMDPAFTALTVSSFRSNALPAYLELELGVLEPDTMRQYNQMIKDGLVTRAEELLAKRISKVQIFRKRIPLRTVAQ